MTTMFKIEIDQPTMTAARTMLQDIPRGFKVAAMRAANKTALQGRTIIKDKLSGELGLKKSATGRVLKIDKANKNIPSARLRVRSRELNLIEYGARKTATGVTSKKLRVTHAFIAHGLGKQYMVEADAGASQEAIAKATKKAQKMSRGNRLVFIRTGIFKRMTKGAYKGRRREVIKGVPGPLNAADIRRTATPIFTSALPAISEFMRQNLADQIKFLVTARGKATLARAEELRARGD